MPNAFAGLISGTQFNNNQWNTRSNRRKIFHDYPTGNFPLTGFLSMLESDWTDAPEFSWREKVWKPTETIVAAGSTVPFTAAGSDTSLGAEVDFTVGQLVRVHIADKTRFRERQVIRIEDLPITGGSTADLHGIVVAIVNAVSAIEVQIIKAVDNVVNTTNDIENGTPGPVEAPVCVIGTANAEGSNSTGGLLITPYKPENYTQIFKNPFSVTGTALVQPTDWDGRGTYPELAQDNLLEHMSGMELAFLYGTRSIEYVMDDGEEVPRRTMGGLKWFFEQYEAANSIYRGGAGAPAITDINDPEKRIIRFANGSVNASMLFGTLFQRLFQCTSNKGFEKLALCGNGVLGALETYLKGHVHEHKGMKSETEWGWNVYTVETTYGTIHFKSHPLLNRSPSKMYECFILDVGNAVYRPLKGRDTRKFKGRQHPDQDRRKDLWQTECSLEYRLPQSGMYLRNLRTIVDA